MEVPLLFFGTKKELLSNIVESFLNLLSPFEYQYPNCAILPDNYLAILEISKSFVFGINHKWSSKVVNNKVTFFKDHNLSLFNKIIIICDTDERKLIYFYNNTSRHIVDFKDFGVYNINNNSVDDQSILTSPDININNFFDVRNYP